MVALEHASDHEISSRSRPPRRCWRAHPRAPPALLRWPLPDPGRRAAGAAAPTRPDADLRCRDSGRPDRRPGRLKSGTGSSITVGLVGRNGVIWSEAFGAADRAAGQAATARTMFGIGSLGKLFATLAVMRLVERGVVDLDRPLVEYVPDFRMASPEYRQIAVRMLLDHSAGLPGTDYRNGESSAPIPGYLDQVLQSLSIER